MRQFIVLKVVVSVLGAAMSTVPLGGLMPLETAQELHARLVQAEPEAVFLIQEVGKA